MLSYQTFSIKFVGSMLHLNQLNVLSHRSKAAARDRADNYIIHGISRCARWQIHFEAACSCCAEPRVAITYTKEDLKAL